MEKHARHHMLKGLAAVGAAMACLAGSASAWAAPMNFEVVPQRTRDPGAGVSAAIYAHGDITVDTARRFEETVERNKVKDAVVYFDSTGGLVVESIRLGQVIRKRGYATSVEKGAGATGKAMCASACVYAYAGGVARYLDDDRGSLGVHQYYASKLAGATDAKDDLKVAQLLGSVIVAHLQQMGISSALYVAAAMTDSSKMLWMDRRQAHSFDLVNNGELPAKADIRLTDDGKPYLQITQLADKGETHVVISCDAKGITLASGATGDKEMLLRVRGQAVRNALQINGRSVYPVDGRGGMTEVGEDGVQTGRSIDAATLAEVDQAGTLGFSVDGISGRWTREIDVAALRDKIAYYTRTCANRH